jgi:hypothetical protein
LGYLGWDFGQLQWIDVFVATFRHKPKQTWVSPSMFIAKDIFERNDKLFFLHFQTLKNTKVSNDLKLNTHVFARAHHDGSFAGCQVQRVSAALAWVEKGETRKRWGRAGGQMCFVDGISSSFDGGFYPSKCGDIMIYDSWLMITRGFQFSLFNGFNHENMGIYPYTSDK